MKILRCLNAQEILKLSPHEISIKDRMIKRPRSAVILEHKFYNGFPSGLRNCRKML